MRLWSLHPSYLDRIGLVAVWREGLLARQVLQGKTRGYRHHPQLGRFLAHPRPLAAIEAYLWGIYEESVLRGYHFKSVPRPQPTELQVTEGQLEYELTHLLRKLKTRDPARYKKLASVDMPQAHPLFRVVPGPIEAWERVSYLPSDS